MGSLVRVLVSERGNSPSATCWMDVVTQARAAGTESVEGQARRQGVQREKTGREKRKERRMLGEPKSVTGKLAWPPTRGSSQRRMGRVEVCLETF